MPINDRLRQVAKVGLTALALSGGSFLFSEKANSAPEKTTMTQQALPENYSDLLTGEKSEKIQPYLDLMRETDVGRNLLASMRQNGVRLEYQDVQIGNDGIIWGGLYDPDNNVIRVGARDNPLGDLWFLYHESQHSVTHANMNKLGYAKLPTQSLDDAYVANAIDEALAERTAAEGVLETLKSHPEMKDQKSDYSDLIQKYKREHPEMNFSEMPTNVDNPGWLVVKDGLDQGRSQADIVQDVFDKRLKGYDGSRSGYERQVISLYDSGNNQGKKMGINPDWDQYVSEITEGRVTHISSIPSSSVWGFHDRLSREFSRLGNDTGKTGQMDLSCPIDKAEKETFLEEDLRSYAALRFENIYNEVPSVQQDILKLTGCNPTQTYKNAVGKDLYYYETDTFKQTSERYSREEYMDAACKIYTHPDVQKFLETTYPGEKSEIMSILAMREVLFTPDEKMPAYVRPIVQAYDGTQQATNQGVALSQDTLKHLAEGRVWRF